jgi:hypothetical protein
MMVAQVVPITLGIVALQTLDAVPATAGLLALCSAPHSASPFSTSIRRRSFSAIPAACRWLAFYTLLDPTLTLFRRMAAGEQISSAHRMHFYQRAVAQGLSVPQVTARLFLLGVLLVLLAVATVLAKSLAVDLLCLGFGLAATGIMLYALSSGQ